MPQSNDYTDYGLEVKMLPEQHKVLLVVPPHERHFGFAVLTRDDLTNLLQQMEQEQAENA